jgi:hypothetical protein
MADCDIKPEVINSFSRQIFQHAWVAAPAAGSK